MLEYPCQLQKKFKRRQSIFGASTGYRLEPNLGLTMNKTGMDWTCLEDTVLVLSKYAFKISADWPHRWSKKQ